LFKWWTDIHLLFLAAFSEAPMGHLACSMTPAVFQEYYERQCNLSPWSRPSKDPMFDSSMHERKIKMKEFCLFMVDNVTPADLRDHKICTALRTYIRVLSLCHLYDKS
jgi:hypothetical protein